MHTASMFFAGLTLLLAASASSQTPPPKIPPPPSQAQIDKMVATGVAYLKKQQDHLGTWRYRPVQQLQTHDIGVTALCGLTLVECGVPVTDSSVQAAAKFIRGAAPQVEEMYSIALCLMFLDKLNDKKDVDLIRTLAVRLLASQDASGGWGQGPRDKLPPTQIHLAYRAPVLNAQQTRQFLDALAKKGPPKIPETLQVENVWSDNSVTQFAILALWVARQYDIPVDHALALADKRFRQTQSEEGGWSYYMDGGPPHPDGKNRPYASMTCAGLLGLALGYGAEIEAHLKTKGAKGKFGARGDPQEDRAVRAAKKFLANCIDEAGDPTVTSHDWMFYMLWSIERVCVAFDWQTIEGKDWYAWGARYLMKAQREFGGWEDQVRGAPNIDTCFALLFLKRSNLVVDLTAGLKGEASLKTKGVGKEPNEPKDPKDPMEPKDPPKDPPRPPSDPVEADAWKLGQDLVNGTGDQQLEALRKLKENKGGPYTIYLADAISKLQGGMRDQARAALVERLTRMKVSTLRDYLAQGNAELRRAAATAAAEKGAIELADDIQALTKDSDPEVAAAAAKALKCLRD